MPSAFAGLVHRFLLINIAVSKSLGERIELTIHLVKQLKVILNGVSDLLSLPVLFQESKLIFLTHRLM